MHCRGWNYYYQRYSCRTGRGDIGPDPLWPEAGGRLCCNVTTHYHSHAVGTAILYFVPALVFVVIFDFCRHAAPAGKASTIVNNRWRSAHSNNEYHATPGKLVFPVP